MKYAINLNTVLPVRAEASEKSEMVTQLLFGEYFSILEEGDNFFKIKNAFDNYTGWVDKKMLIEISSLEFERLSTQDIYRSYVPIADVFCMNDKTICRLSAGSLLPNYDPSSSKFGIGYLQFQVHPSFVTHLPDKNKNGIIDTAMSFLNTPYLWGGKNIMGIDCSGFVQVVYSINGFNLPRDASQQAEIGETINFTDMQLGDLLFFEKEKRITHVGIYIGNDKIIHASGKVKIETIKTEGILNNINNTYSHNLSIIKRIQ